VFYGEEKVEIIHTPVLLQECLFWLTPEGEPYEKKAFMIDSTLGEGGHSFAFLSEFPGLSILGVDADASIQARARERLAAFGPRMQFFNGWFNDFYAAYPSGIPKPQIILFDLGISSYHYIRSGKGFSFLNDEPLDMRLDSGTGKSAADIVNMMTEKELADILYLYSEEKFSHRIAKAIVAARNVCTIASSKALADIIYEAVPPQYRYGKIHPATRTFQALRIAVNSELQRLPAALFAAFNILECGGKMGVITFHSLEDRIVKNCFRNLGKQCVCPPEVPVCMCGGKPCAELLTRKPVVPTETEVKRNPPSRSAKLRVVKKLRNTTEYHIFGFSGGK